MAAPVHRFSVNAPESTKREMDFLGELTAHNQTEVFKNAVTTYAGLAKLAVAGVPVYVKDTQGREIPYAVPGVPQDTYIQALIQAAGVGVQPPQPE